MQYSIFQERSRSPQMALPCQARLSLVESKQTEFSGLYRQIWNWGLMRTAPLSTQPGLTKLGLERSVRRIRQKMNLGVRHVGSLHPSPTSVMNFSGRMSTGNPRAVQVTIHFGFISRERRRLQLLMIKV